LSLGVILLLGLGALALRRPSNSREWIADHARIPTSELQGERVHIEGIRDFRYVTAGSVHQDYYDATFTLSKIASLWFVLSIFHEENFRGPAHSMLSFGFADGSYVAISVEARKEVGESYSIYQGLLELFVDMLRSANSLHEKPQFYNTAFHNCTTVLRDHVNAVAPGRMPHSWKVLLPGYSDELLESLGLLDSDLTVEQARQRY
jgi:hypothetical protein